MADLFPPVRLLSVSELRDYLGSRFAEYTRFIAQVATAQSEVSQLSGSDIRPPLPSYGAILSRKTPTCVAPRTLKKFHDLTSTLKVLVAEGGLYLATAKVRKSPSRRR